MTRGPTGGGIVGTAGIAATRGRARDGGEPVSRKRRIGLRQATGGFATQPFLVDKAERRVAVVGTELVVRDDVLGEADERRVPITNLRAAGGLAGGPLGMPPDAYRPSPMPDPDGELAVDPGAVALFADFCALVQRR